MILKKMRQILRGEQGFTLVELMVVVIILGILAGIAVPQFLNNAETAREQAAQSSLQNMKSALDVWSAQNNGQIPLAANTGVATGTSADVAGVLSAAGIIWNGTSSGFRDPWGTSFNYSVITKSATDSTIIGYIITCGPDKSSTVHCYEVTDQTNAAQVTSSTVPTTVPNGYSPTGAKVGTAINSYAP